MNLKLCFCCVKFKFPWKVLFSEYLNNKSFYNDSETISVILNLNIFSTFLITLNCYISVSNIHPNSIVYCQKFSFILLCCHSYVRIFRSLKIWVFWDVMLCHGKCTYKNCRDYSAFIFRVLTLKMKSLWPFETWVTFLAQWHSITPIRLVSNTTVRTLNLTSGACFTVKHPFFRVSDHSWKWNFESCIILNWMWHIWIVKVAYGFRFCSE